MSVGRFQVMAMLQAARAHALGLDDKAARSWGLNRAIFYAAAKRGFKSTAPLKSAVRPKRMEAAAEMPEEFHLGDEKAYKAESEPLVFTFGGKVQTEEEFKGRISSRFGRSYDKAWTEALELMENFDRELLLSQAKFFEQVYKPRRDQLAAKWSEMAAESSEIPEK
ncbi:MAG: hypothetical protein C4K47_10035 [Candidatus Thorarchaeota archaeon]|nr:MAG: hypothetical protein C4K47_10035 [Candidatus Thorarchaeota archaeon]